MDQGFATANQVVRNNQSAKSDKPLEVGRILSVGSSAAIVSINNNIISHNKLHLVQLGTILSIVTNSSVVVAMVSSLKVGGKDNEGMHAGCIAQLDIMGEITTNQTTRKTKFFRGVRSFPVLNQPVYTMTPRDLEVIFATGTAPCIEVGSLQQDSSIKAFVKTDDLLSKHFAIVGSTGSGKSCTVALVLQAILAKNPDAHVVLFDPHNEYSKSFGDKAQVIGLSQLDLPIWLFDFDETIELLTSEIKDHKRLEIEVLSEILLKAKQLYDRSLNEKGQLSGHVKFDDTGKDLHRVASHISLDSPVPYRMRDVIRLLEHYMGKLDNAAYIAPCKRLIRRIDFLMADPRYQFVFKNQATPRSIKDITGTIFRIPVVGKPICIMDLSGIPSEALNILVSVVSRLAFELAMWSQRSVPILLVCEEAHRYIPADPSLGFHSTRKSIARIAKEGRKYGVSLGIISQRPSELEASTLSQCSTIFSMRLSNEKDQDFVRASIPDGAGELLAFLPSLGTAETMVFGESVSLPMRVILNTLAPEYLPHSSSAKFSDLWNAGEVSDVFMNNVFESWRARSFNTQKTTITSHHQRPPTTQTSQMRREQAPMQAPMQAAVQTSANPHVNASAAGGIADVKRMLNKAFHKNL